MKNQNIIVGILIAIVFGLVGFFGGTKYQQGQDVQLDSQRGLRGQFNGQNVQGGSMMRQTGAGGVGSAGGMNGQGFRPVAGQIIAADSKSITVKMPDGSSKIVLISTTATINKAVDGAMADLTVGKNVRVFGTTNTDGSVTASNIQLVTEPLVTPQPTQTN